MMRKVGIVAGILIGFLVLVIAAAWLLIDVNRYHDPIQAQLEHQLGRKASLGKMNLGLFPLRFEVADTAIAEDPAFGQSQFVHADNLAVQVSLLSLLRGDVKVESLQLKHPSVELIRNKDGVWNFSTIGGTAPATPPAENRPAEGRQTAFSLDQLSVIDGQVAITDLQKNQQRSVYDHIDLKLDNFTAGQPFTFELAAHLQGQGKEELKVAGTGGPFSQGAPAETPFRGTFTITEVGLDGLSKFLDTGALTKMAGSLSGDAQVSNQKGVITAVGKLKLDGARFNDLDIGYPIALDYNLAANTSEGMVTINDATLRLGQTPVSLTGSVNTSATPPNLDLKLKSGDVSIAEMARLASAFGVAFAPGTDVAGRVTADVAAKGPASGPALSGAIAARDLKISGQSVPQPVEVKALDLKLSPNEIQSNEFNATSGQTTIAARFALKDYTSKSPSVDAGVRAPNATLPEIQSIAKAYGVTGLDQITGSGGLNFDLHAAGPLQSLTADSVTRALNGTVNLDFSPLRIAGFDAAHEVAGIGGFANGLTKQNFTEIVKLTGRLLVKNGIAQTNDLHAQLGIGTLAAAGTADLSAQTLNMKVSTVFNKEFSDKVGGSKVGGFMTTALANPSGELVIPSIVTGSFKQPKFSPDVQAIAQMQKQRLLPSLENPAGALGLLKGLTSKGDAKADQNPDQKQPLNVKGILGGILGGKKKPQN